MPRLLPHPVVIGGELSIGLRDVDEDARRQRREENVARSQPRLFVKSVRPTVPVELASPRRGKIKREPLVVDREKDPLKRSCREVAVEAGSEADEARVGVTVVTELLRHVRDDMIASPNGSF